MAVGTSVLAQDRDTFVTETATVEHVHRFLARTVVHLALPGEDIYCTPDHPFWVVGRGWTRAADCGAGDDLLGMDGQPVPIIGVDRKELNKPIPVYNISVGSSETFFIGRSGVLVHNKNV